MKKRLLYLIYSLLFFLPAMVLAQTASHVVISQVYGAGGNAGATYQNDYVELYNPTSTDVVMTGWSLQYQSAAGVSAYSGLMPFPDGATVKSHGYYLVQLAGATTNGVALPVTADYIPLASNTTISFNMSGASGKVALCNTVTNLSGTPASTAASPPPLLVTTSIVDFMTYGTVNYNNSFVLTNPAVPATASATGAAPGLTVTAAVVRLANSASTAATMAIGGTDATAGNGYDIDNNGAEFVLVTVATGIAPRNSSTVVGGSTSTPSLTANPTTLDFGTTQVVGTTSTSKSFTLAGANLSASASVAVTGPYKISKDNTVFGTTALTYTTAELSATTAPSVYVQFIPTGATAASGVGTVSVTSGTTTTSVGLTGTGVSATPTLTAGSTTLTFASQAANTTSSAQTFTLSGTALTTNTTVGVTAPFAISKDGINYSTLLVYTPTELATTQTVSVVFAPTSAGSPTATITIASAGATSKTLALTGTATAASGGGGGVSPGGASHVVISQVYGAGGNAGATYQNDYVELYNPTSTDVVMTGWSLQYQSAAGVSAYSGLMPFPDGATVKSHGYYLVQLAGATTNGVALPVTADYIPLASNTTISFNMSGASGKVALCNTVTNLSGTPASTAASPPPLLVTTSIVDFMTYGTVNYNNSFVLTNPAVPATASATGAAPGLTVTASDVRLANSASTAATMAIGGTDATAGNGYDIDNNGTEFVLVTVATGIAPRNSSTIAGGGSSTTTTPTLTSSATALDFGTTQTINTTSAAKTFTLTGANLTAGATLTTAAPFSVSADNITYGTSATFTAAQLLTAQTVYVKFTPAVVTAYTGGLTVSSAGAIGQGVILTGSGSNVVAVPTVTPSSTTLAFGSVNTTAPSVKTFTVSGSTLTSNTVVAATAPYTVSKDGTTFSASISFTAAELAATTAPTVSVKFTPTAAGAANSNVTLTNPDLSVSPVNVAVTGTGVVPTLTAATTPTSSPVTVAFGNVTNNTVSGAQSFTLTGANLTASVVLTAAAPFTISTDGGTTYGITGTITAATLATAQTILVKYSPTALGASTGNISITSTGAATATVALTGTSVSAPVPTLSLAPSLLTFSGLVGSTSAAQTYTITGTNLTGASTVTVAAPYSVSKTATGTYGLTLSYTTAELATAQTVYVKFSPTAVAVNGVNDGAVINATAGGTNQTVTLNGTGIGVPALTLAPTTLTFSGVTGTTSAAQTFTITGAYITAAATTVTVAAPYSISKTVGGTYGTTLSYTTAEMASVQTVYVQFTAPATLGAANGSVSVVSTGATTQSVTLNGTSLATPSLALSTNTLTFVQSAGAASVAQTFTITGSNLIGNTTVTAPSLYTISKDGTTYSSSLTYTTTELASAKTVSVIYTPTGITGLNASTGSISVSSSGATSQTVALLGTGVNSTPTLAAIADQNVCYTPNQQIIALSGISAGTETTQTTAVSVTSNNPGLFSQIGILPLTATTAQLNYTLAPGASGTATVSISVKDNGGVANAPAGVAIDTYTRTFNITVNALAVITITSDAPGNLVEKGSTATLTASGGTSYSWTSNATITSPLTGASVTIRPSVATTYTVVATNATGCTTTQTISIAIRAAAKLETSNVITPNGDGINDVWVIRNIDLYPGNSVKVIDKAGKVVFTKAGYNNDWFGTYNGTPLTQGTYYYVVDLGTGVTYSGYLSIVRD